ncbi:MAG: histidine ammonia-lyase [bacterium]
MKNLTLGAKPLTLAQLSPLAEGQRLKLRVSAKSYAQLKPSRQMVEEAVGKGEVVYGLTTGFGKLKHKAVSPKDLHDLQRNLVLSHSVGSGPDMFLSEARLVVLLRIVSLLRGVSGVRPALVKRMVAFFNCDLIPAIPQQGSVGASGDLAPLSHMAAAWMGHGHSYLQGKRMGARAALKKAGLEPLVLEAKEGLALINGTEVMKSLAVCQVIRAMNLSRVADIVAAISLEALMGSPQPFGKRLTELKRSDGQARTAANVRRMLRGSQVVKSHDQCDRVQDPYSLRCVPQIHGAFKTALQHVVDVLGDELGAVTDNPIVDPVTSKVFSAGLFHGQPLSMILDYLGLSCCTLANVSERRIEQMVNPDLSGLPAFLTPDPGLHSGMMITQYAAAALVSENKIHAHPASVDSVPTSANQEDHVSMGVTAGRKARTILDNTQRVLSIEWICAAQARGFRAELKAGKGVEAGVALLRTKVKALKGDRYLKPDLDAAEELIASGALVAAVEKSAGALSF